MPCVCTLSRLLVAGGVWKGSGGSQCAWRAVRSFVACSPLFFISLPDYGVAYQLCVVDGLHVCCRVPPEAHSAQLHPNAFLDPSALLEWCDSFILNASEFDKHGSQRFAILRSLCHQFVCVSRYENCLENLFDRDEEVQATAVQAIQQLAGPIEFPHEYIVVSAEDESIPKQAVRASQLTVETTETQELLANVLDRSSKGSVAEAAFILGVLSATGVSPVVEQNDAYATKMYSLAADYGSISGHLALAHRYEQGFNVPKSCSIAYGHLKVRSPLLFATTDLCPLHRHSVSKHEVCTQQRRSSETCADCSRHVCTSGRCRAVIPAEASPSASQGAVAHCCLHIRRRTSLLRRDAHFGARACRQR